MNLFAYQLYMFMYYPWVVDIIQYLRHLQALWSQKKAFHNDLLFVCLNSTF